MLPAVFRLLKRFFPNFYCTHDENHHQSDKNLEAHSHRSESHYQFLLFLSLGCLIFGISAITVDSIPYLTKFFLLKLFFFSCAYIFGSWHIISDIVQELKLKKLNLDIHFLMLTVACGAALIGSYREGVLLLFLFSASETMESYAMRHTTKAINMLLKVAPKKAHLLINNHQEDIEIEKLLPKMVILVMAGEKIPADIEIIGGESECDESMITGESLPVAKKIGNIALSGTLNLWGILEGRVLRMSHESTLQKIIDLIQQSQQMKAPSQRFTDKFGTKYTVSILIICLCAFLYWWLKDSMPAFSMNHLNAFYRAMTLLVVSSPCALIISVPSAILSAIASGARNGILYRGGVAFETLADVSIFAFDKTGTLTSGNFSITNINILRGDPENFKAIAQALACLSDHPLSVAIRLIPVKTEKNFLVTHFEMFAGKGIKGDIDYKRYWMGNRQFIEQSGYWQTDTICPSNIIGTIVWLAGDGIFGYFILMDEIRIGTLSTINKLHQAGIRTVMLTGDHLDIARFIGKQLNISELYAELTPEKKVEILMKFKDGGKKKVAMLGDGVNDAPCLAASDVAISMGIRGSDVALEESDIVLMNDRIEKLILARELSVRSKYIIRQNIAIALTTVICMSIITFIYPLPLTVGVSIHEGSTILVVLNSLRLLNL